MYEKTLFCKFLSVFNHNICQLPQVLNVKYFADEDIPLGKYLISAYTAFNTICSVCSKNEIGQHVFYYIKGGGRVKIEFLRNESQDFEIYMKNHCRECNKFYGAPVFLSQSA